MDGRLTRGFAADAAPPPGYFMAPQGAQNLARCARGIWEKNGLRRGEECPLGMVKNLPAADGEEQLALS